MTSSSQTSSFQTSSSYSAVPSVPGSDWNRLFSLRLVIPSSVPNNNISPAWTPKNLEPSTLIKVAETPSNKDLKGDEEPKYYYWQRLDINSGSRIKINGRFCLKYKCYYQPSPLNIVQTTDGRKICVGSSYYYCYLLKSSTTRRTYFGATNDLTKRLRQHNGQLKGGAKTTTRGRPWKMVVCISGFLTLNEAFSFEWYNHHPGKKMRSHGLLHRIRVLASIIKDGRWRKKYPIKTNIISVFWRSERYNLGLAPNSAYQEYFV